MKKTGESIRSKSKVIDTGDLNVEVGKIEELDILEQIEKSKNFSLIKLLKENPEVIISELNKVLYWMSISEDWFVALTQITAPDGNILSRFTISPPKDKKIEIIINEKDNSKKVSLAEKVSAT